jgi:hypothetical protein
VIRLLHPKIRTLSVGLKQVSAHVGLYPVASGRETRIQRGSKDTACVSKCGASCEKQVTEKEMQAHVTVP